MASSSALIARCTSFFTMSSYSCFTTFSSSRNRLRCLRWDQRVLLQPPLSSSLSTMNGLIDSSDLSLTSAFEILSCT
jgi:hypothetical protein